MDTCNEIVLKTCYLFGEPVPVPPPPAHAVHDKQLGRREIKVVKGDGDARVWDAIHHSLRIILKLRILVLLAVLTLPYVVKVKNYS
jgi:hypothetical protein